MRRKRRQAAREAPTATVPNAAAEALRREQLQRLATAAALETYASLEPGSAWDVASQMPELVRAAICIAARGAIGDAKRRQVRALLAEWQARPEARGVAIRRKLNAAVGE